MTVQYNFTNGNNWSEFWRQTFTAPSVNPVTERFYPIGTVKPFQTFHSPIIKVFCANIEARPNWKYGGRYLVKIFAGSVVSGGIPETVIKVGKIYLDQAEIIQIPPYRR